MQTKKIELFLFFLLLFTGIFIVYTYGFLIKSNGDNIEHIHTSWLIWQKNIPYRDFFQHHNPLIWYMFSPIVAFFINDVKIFFIFNVISVVAFLLVILFEAKILLQNGLKKNTVLIFSLITLSSFSILCSMDYRPDTFMYLFFFIGIFYWFEYNKKANLKDIVISFLCFFLSFMCSQKILLNLALIGGILLYEVFIKKIKKQDFAFGIVLPCMLLLLFFTYLYVNDALIIYLKSNYYFNSYVPTIFENQRISMPPLMYYEFYIFVPLGLLGALFFLFKGNFSEKILSLLFLEEICLRAFYFSAFLHYNVLLLMLSIMIAVIYLDRVISYKKILFCMSLLCIFFAIYYNYIKTYIPEYARKDFKANYEFAFKNTNHCDYVINGYYSVYNIKSKNPGFYSILLGQIDVLGEKLGIAPKSNLNELILQYMPKIIFGGVYWDTYEEDRGRMVPVHFVDRDILKTYYDNAAHGNLYILKPKYQKHKCRYNGKRWEYED
ncbi:MAG: hypothetical protein IKW39_04665 [Alphaproteobacteria bacterium]|nr:hypothetical protein [Alphaproteobacteria bacterium]